MAPACFSTAPWGAAVDFPILVMVFIDGGFGFVTYDGLHGPDGWSYIIVADILPTSTVRMEETTWTMEVLCCFCVLFCLAILLCIRFVGSLLSARAGNVAYILYLTYPLRFIFVFLMICMLCVYLCSSK